MLHSVCPKMNLLGENQGVTFGPFLFTPPISIPSHFHSHKACLGHGTHRLYEHRLLLFDTQCPRSALRPTCLSLTRPSSFRRSAWSSLPRQPSQNPQSQCFSQSLPCILQPNGIYQPHNMNIETSDIHPLHQHLIWFSLGGSIGSSTGYSVLSLWWKIKPDRRM